MSAAAPVAAQPWDVPGQQLAVDVLRSAVQRGEVSHAWAFVGPPGSGRRAARWLAAALNCGSFQPPCGACDVCDRCLRGAHPALDEFVPTGSFHRVDEVRERWLRTASRSLVEGSWRVLRVVDADRMNEAAANAFLKGLEEPPPQTVWILDVADPDELPDTIGSRCRSVRFAAWSPDDLDAEALRLGLDDPTDRALAVRAALGSPLTLRRLAWPGGLDDLRAHRSIPARLRREGPGAALLVTRALDDEVKRRLAAVKAEGRAELEQLAERAGDSLPRGLVRQVEDRNTRREREARVATLQAALDDLLGWYRDCLLVAGGGAVEAVLHADAGDALRADADALGCARLLRSVDHVLAARDSLELNVQQGLALEALLLELSTVAMT